MSSRRSRSGGSLIVTTLRRKYRSWRNLPSPTAASRSRMRRRDQADVDLDRLVAADAEDLLVLQHAQQLGLQRQRHVADFVEEQRAAVGVLEAALAQPVGAGERAGLVAEQLVVEQVLVEGGAVHRRRTACSCAGCCCGWPGRPSSLPVPVSPWMSTVAVVGAMAWQRLEDLVHARAVADDALEAELLVELPFQLAVGSASRRRSAALSTMARSSARSTGLVQVIGRPLLDRLHGRLHVAVAGDHDDLGVGQLLAGLAEDGQAVEVGHLADR